MTLKRRPLTERIAIALPEVGSGSPGWQLAKIASELKLTDGDWAVFIEELKQPSFGNFVHLILKRLSEIYEQD